MRENRKPKKSPEIQTKSEWEIDVHYTKSMFHGGGRGVVVTVTHLPTGKSLKKSETASTKNEARSKVNRIAEELKEEIKRKR